MKNNPIMYDPSDEITEDSQITFTVPEDLSGKRADVAVLPVISEEYPGFTRSSLQRLFDSGAITVNEKQAKKSTTVSEGDVISITVPEPEPSEVEPENIPLDIIYEDSDIVIINKPRGMVVHPSAGHLTGTLVSALLYHCGDSLSGIGGIFRPGIVHRIDKDTTGLICIAKNDSAHIKLSEQLKDHSMHREYTALCKGNIDTSGEYLCISRPIARSKTDRKKMAIDDDGKEAVTNYCTESVYSPPDNRLFTMTLLKVRLSTGRTHQIRVHMSSIGHPVIGDPLYGGAENDFCRKHPGIITGQLLHASDLFLTHPSTGELMKFHADLPEDFSSVLKILEPHKTVSYGR